LLVLDALALHAVGADAALLAFLVIAVDPFRMRLALEARTWVKTRLRQKTI
jgi:hypothetical protein